MKLSIQYLNCNPVSIIFVSAPQRWDAPLMIAKIDDLDNPEILTEVWRGAMAEVDLNAKTPEYYLNELESQVSEVGWEAMRHLMVEQWKLTDGVLVERFRQEQAGAVVGDGYDPLKVVSRMGVVQLPRQG